MNIKQVYDFMLSLLKYGGIAMMSFGLLVIEWKISVMGIMAFLVAAYKQLDDRIIALEKQEKERA